MLSYKLSYGGMQKGFVRYEVTSTSLHATTLPTYPYEHPLSLKGRIRRSLLFLAHTFFLEREGGAE